MPCLAFSAPGDRQVAWAECGDPPIHTRPRPPNRSPPYPMRFWHCPSSLRRPHHPPPIQPLPCSPAQVHASESATIWAAGGREGVLGLRVRLHATLAEERPVGRKVTLAPAPASAPPPSDPPDLPSPSTPPCPPLPPHAPTPRIEEILQRIAGSNKVCTHPNPTHPTLPYPTLPYASGRSSHVFEGLPDEL